MSTDKKFIEVNEKNRTYCWPSGELLDCGGVISIKVSESGIHYLNCADGRKMIVRPTWDYIRLDIDEWTF